MHTIQILGVISAASYVAARVARASRVAAFHRYAIMAQPRTSLPAMPRGFRVEALDAAVLARHQVDASPEVQSLRFAAGLTCLGVFDRQDRLTGLVWLGTGTYAEDEVAVSFLLPSHCCWDTGLWIEPAYRMGRSFAALWAGVSEWMAARGLTHSLSRVADYNLPALTAHHRMGGVVLAYHSFLRIGRWQWSRTARPWLVRADGTSGLAAIDLGALDLPGN